MKSFTRKFSDTFEQPSMLKCGFLALILQTRAEREPSISFNIADNCSFLKHFVNVIINFSEFNFSFSY